MKKQTFTKKHILPLLSALLLLSATTTNVHAQFDPSIKEGIKYKLNEDGSHWVKMNMTSQIWLRYNENNPGSSINGFAVPESYDVGIRRIRFVLSGQVTDRMSFFVQLGQNSFDALSARKTGIFFHDITLDYTVIKKNLTLGAGLMGWDGIGRFTNPSTGNILSLDLPVFAQTENDLNEQDVRKLGVYAKGKIEKLDYRISVASPFAIGVAGSTAPDPIAYKNSTYSTLPAKASYQGYFMYQFFDQESNFGAGTTGTYLGKKKVFNIGAGFKYQDKAMFHYGDTMAGYVKKDTVYNPLVIWGVDVYYDAPINKDKGTAVTFYAGYFNYNYGAGYIRNVAPMNPVSGTIAGLSSFNGSGNGWPQLGTGNVLYAQGGYKFKDGLLGSEGTLLPYATILYAQYDRLKDPVITAGAGINWLISGHNQKITLGVENRPIYYAQTNGDITSSSRKNEIVLQYHVAF